MIGTFIDERGVLLRRDVVYAGLDDTLITQAMRDRVLVRIKPGAYCVRTAWQSAGPADRHRLRSHAVRRLYDDAHARSHVTAVLELGGPDWGLDLDLVHLTHLYGIGDRTQSGVKHHRGSLLVGDLTRHDGSWLTSPPRSALDTAASAQRDPAVCVLNWVMSSRLATREQLAAGISQMVEWPGTLGLDYKLSLANGKSESVLETRGDLFCLDRRLPRFTPQLEVFEGDGTVAGRVDGAWPQLGRWVEFDGVTKYLKHRRPGESVEECVLREKAREDLIRRLTGWMCLRVVWADLGQPDVLEARIRAFLATRAA